jgi:hypothetical protein
LHRRAPDPLALNDRNVAGRVEAVNQCAWSEL